MDIKTVLISGTREEFAQALSQPDGWDRWVCGFSISQQYGPTPVMAGVIGTLGVAYEGVAISIHPHDSVEDALDCWARMGERVQRNTLMLDPRSHEVPAVIDIDADTPAALPVSTDEPTARTFGWL